MTTLPLPPPTPCVLTSPPATCWCHFDKIEPGRDVELEFVIFGPGVAVGLGAEAEVDDLGSIALLFIKTHNPLLRLVDGLSYVDGLSAPKDLGRLSIVLSAKHSIFDKLPGRVVPQHESDVSSCLDEKR